MSPPSVRKLAAYGLDKATPQSPPAVIREPWSARAMAVSRPLLTGWCTKRSCWALLFVFMKERAGHEELRCLAATGQPTNADKSTPWPRLEMRPAFAAVLRAHRGIARN